MAWFALSQCINRQFASWFALNDARYLLESNKIASILDSKIFMFLLASYSAPHSLFLRRLKGTVLCFKFLVNFTSKKYLSTILFLLNPV